MSDVLAVRFQHWQSTFRQGTKTSGVPDPKLIIRKPYRWRTRDWREHGQGCRLGSDAFVTHLAGENGENGSTATLTNIVSGRQLEVSPIITLVEIASGSLQSQ